MTDVLVHGDVTEEIPAIVLPPDVTAGTRPPAAAPTHGGNRPRVLAFTSRVVAYGRAIPHVGTWFGVLVTAVGFVMIGIGWGKVAGLTVVGLQMPYLVSCVCTGLGLVVGGLTVINVDAKARDATARREQLSELRETLVELRTILQDEP